MPKTHESSKPDPRKKKLATTKDQTREVPETHEIQKPDSRLIKPAMVGA